MRLRLPLPAWRLRHAALLLADWLLLTLLHGPHAAPQLAMALRDLNASSYCFSWTDQQLSCLRLQQLIPAWLPAHLGQQHPFALLQQPLAVQQLAPAAQHKGYKKRYPKGNWVRQTLNPADVVIQGVTGWHHSPPE